MKKTIKNAMSSLTAKLAALLFAFTCASGAWGATTTVATQADLTSAVAAAAAGDTVQITAAGTYTLPSIPQNITIEGTVDGVEFECKKTEASGTTDCNICDIPNGVTFKHVTFRFVGNSATSDNLGWTGSATGGSLEFEDCNFYGEFFNYYMPMVFRNCVFTQEVNNYHMWIYGPGKVSYIECTFNYQKKCLHIYNHGTIKTHDVYLKDCVFKPANASDSDNKGDINVKNTGGSPTSITIIIDNCNTTNERGLVQFENALSNNPANTSVAIGTDIVLDENGDIVSGEFTTLYTGSTAESIISSGSSIEDNGNGTYTVAVDPYAAYTKVADGFYQNAATYAASTDFYITSKEGLEYFRDLVNQVGTVADTYVTTYVNASSTAASWYTGNIFTGKTVHLMTDVDLENVEWSPIGQPANPAGDKRRFYGHFNGENHTISNLKATTYVETIKTWYPGLFGALGPVSGQTISNLTINNVTLIGYDYAGAIVGNAGSNPTAFNNCHVTGNIDIKCTMTGAFVGGIVGIGTCAIDDCSVEGGTGSTIQGSTVGGLAGTSTRTANENANTVTDSTVTGVTVKSDDNGGQAGGLVGKATNPVTVTGNTVRDVTVSAEKGDADALVSAGTTTASNNTTDTNVTIVEHFVAQIGETKYKTLAEAIAAVGAGDVTIELLDDAEFRYPARSAYGTDETTKLTIKGNGHTLNLIGTDTDWSSLGLKNPESVLAFENMTINKTEKGNGAWNNHALNITSKLEMKAVTVNNSLAVRNDAKLENVDIVEAGGYYGLIITAQGQDVEVKGGSITATNGGRGIKVMDQYVAEAEIEKVAIDIDGTKFTTASKAAVLVTSPKGATITTSNIDISGVAADSTHVAWVDEDCSTTFGETTLNGGQTYPEGGPTEYAATLSSDGKIEGYYKSLDAVVAAYKKGDTITALNYVEGTTVVPEGWVAKTNGGVTTLEEAPKGTITVGYVNASRGVWGEANCNAKESFSVKVCSGETLLGTTTLNNIGGIIDGSVNVTWSALLPSVSDEYWTTVWKEDGLVWDKAPTKVELWVDGVKVAENIAQLNGPDGINPVKWWQVAGVSQPPISVVRNDVVVDKCGTIADALAVAQSGDVVSVPAGEFELKSTAVIPAGVALKGAGKDATTFTISTTNGDGVKITNPNVTISDATINGSAITSGGYKSLINVEADGVVIDSVVMTGGGKSTWNSSILVESINAPQTFTVKNSTISGSFRGVLRESCNANIVIENCDIDAVYPFNIDGGSHGTVTVTDSALHGWTSYSGVDSVTFTNCEFSKAKSGYDCVAAYVDTTFDGCTFDSDFDIYAQTTGFTFELEDCTKNGVALTWEKMPDNFGDADVWNKCTCLVDRERVAFVAQIGDTVYNSLDKALAAAQEGDTVKLIADVAYELTSTSTIGVTIDKSITLDGNGHTITLTGEYASGTYGIHVDSTAAITPTFKNLTIAASGIERAVRFDRAAGGTLDNVTLTTDAVGIHIKGTGDVEISNSSITTKPNDNTHYTAHRRSAVMHGSSATVTLTDNTIVAQASEPTDKYTKAKGVYVGNKALGTVILESGNTITADVALAIDGATDNDNVNPGGKNNLIVNAGNTVTGAWGSPSGYAYKLVTVSGGDYNNLAIADLSLLGKTDSKGNLQISITGGTFPVDVTDYCAEGYTCVPSEDRYVVQVAAGKVARNIEQNKAYASLADAFAEATAGETVQLLADQANLGTVAIPANVILDGNGLTLSGNTTVALAPEGGTVKNVNFDISVKRTTIECVISATPAADAVFTITGNTFNTPSATRQVVIAAEGTVDFTATITGNAFNYATGTKRAFAVVGAADAAKLTLDGNYVADGLWFGAKADGANVSEIAFPQLLTADATTAEKQLPTFITKKDQTDNLPAINGYSTLTAALAAAQSGDTVLLTADATFDAAVTTANHVTIDGQNNTLTASGDWTLAGVADSNSGKLGSITLQKITLKYDAASDYATARLGGNVTLGENVVIDASAVTAAGAKLATGIAVAAGATPEVKVGSAVAAGDTLISALTLGEGASVSVSGLPTGIFDAIVDNALALRTQEAKVTVGETVTYYNTLQEALNAAATARTDATVDVLCDIDMTGKPWAAVYLDGYSGQARNVTINGNDKKITGLGGALVSGVWSNAGVTFKDLTLVGSKVESTGSYAGAFILRTDSCYSITLDNCHVEGATISSSNYAGGLIGYSSMGSGKVLTITNCSVKDSTISGNGSAGGVIGHALGGGNTTAAITGTTVTGNAISGEKAAKTGAVMGTVGAGTCELAATVDGNTLKTVSGDTLVADQILGRAAGGELDVTGGNYSGLATYADGTHGDSNGGKVVISGGTFQTQPSQDAIADGYVAELSQDVNGWWTVGGPFVAKIGNVGYDTFDKAVAAVQSGETIELLADIALTSSARSLAAGTYVIDGAGHTISPADADANRTAQLYFTGNASDASALNITYTNIVFSGFVNRPIYAQNLTAKVTGCTFKDNNVSHDGSNHVILGASAAITVEDSVFENNAVKSVIYLDGASTLAVENSLFKGNTCSGNGVIYLSAKTTGSSVNGSTFDGNQVGPAQNAAVVYLSGPAEVTGNLFKDNVVNVGAAVDKEGVVVLGSAAGGSEITGNAFVNNTLGTTATNRATVWVNDKTDAYTFDVGANYWGDGKAPEVGTEKDLYRSTSAGTMTMDTYATAYAANTEGYGVGVTESAAAIAQIVRNDAVVGYYWTLASAIAAAQEGDTVEILAAEISEGSVKFPATLKNVTIKPADGVTATLKNTNLVSADGSAVDYEGITIDGLVFDNSRILFTGARGGEVVYKDWAIVNCTFKDIVANNNYAAVQFGTFTANKESMNGFTFTNNVIDGVSGSSNSGLNVNRLSGETLIEANIIKNVAWNAFQLLNGAEGSTVTITNNYFASAGDGVVNLYGNNADITFVENAVVNTGSGQGVEWIVDGVDVTGNYWGGGEPSVANGKPVSYSYYTTYAETTDWFALSNPVGAVAVVKTGDTLKGTYYSLEGAIAAAASGDTVTLLADVICPASIDRYDLKDGITLDGAGHTITHKDATYVLGGVLQIPNGATVAVSNVTVVSAGGSGAGIGTGTGSNLTLENVTIDHSVSFQNKRDALALNGDCTIKGDFAVTLGENNWSAISFNTTNETLDFSECTSFTVTDNRVNPTQPVIIAWTEGSTVTGFEALGYVPVESSVNTEIGYEPATSAKVGTTAKAGTTYNFKVGNVYYTTFALAASVAVDTENAVENFADPAESDSYALANGSKLKVTKNGHEPAVVTTEGGAYVIYEKTAETLTTYTTATAIAKIGDTYYSTFDEVLAVVAEAEQAGEPDPTIIVLADPAATQPPTGWAFVPDESVTTLQRAVAQVVSIDAGTGAVTTNEQFATIQDAIEAAGKNDYGTTVEVIRDVTLTDGLDIEKSIVLTGAVNDDGTPKYTVTGIADKTSDDFADIYVSDYDASGTVAVTISNLKLRGFGNGVAADGESSVVTFEAWEEGSTLTVENLDIADFNSYAVATLGDGVLTVQDCTVAGADGRANGGVLAENGAAALAGDNAFGGVAESVTATDGAAVSIAGGSYAGTLSADENSAVVVSGGLFESNLLPPSQNQTTGVFLAAGKIAEAVSDPAGWYEVVDGAYVARVTKPNGDFALYGSLEKAVAAAESGDTVTLLADVELADRIWMKSGITLDGDGHTIKPDATSAKFNDPRLASNKDYAASSSLSVINLANGVTDVTIKNVTVDSNGVYPRALIGTGTGSTITLEDVTLNHTSTTIRGADALALNGDCTIKGDFTVALGERSWSAISFNTTNEKLDFSDCTSFTVTADDRTGTQPLVFTWNSAGSTVTGADAAGLVSVNGTNAQTGFESAAVSDKLGSAAAPSTYNFKVGNVYYTTFALAAPVAVDTENAVENFADPEAAYTLAQGSTLKVAKNGHEPTIQTDGGAYVIAEATTGDVTTYSTETAAVSVTHGTDTAYFATLEEAFAIVANGDTVTLLANVALNADIEANAEANVTLTQGDYEITANGHAIILSGSPLFVVTTTDKQTDAFDAASGYKLVESGSYVYTPTKIVAMIGETPYTTFADAVEAVQDGETITVVGYDAETMDPLAPEGWKFVTDNTVDPAVTTLVRKDYKVAVSDGTTTTQYETIAEATAYVNEQASGDWTIQIYAGTFTEMATVKEFGNNDRSVTIKGTKDEQGNLLTVLKATAPEAGKGWSANFFIDSKGDVKNTYTETLKFADMAFDGSGRDVAGTTDHRFILSTKETGINRYAHNVTVENCTFTPGRDDVSFTAVWMTWVKGLTLRGCRVNGGTKASLFQLGSSSAELSFYDCEATGCKSGLNLQSSGNAWEGTSKEIIVSNCTFNVSGYGIRIDGTDYERNMKIMDGAITANQPVIFRKVTASGKTSEFTVTGCPMTPTGDSPWFTVAASNPDSASQITAPNAGATVKITTDLTDAPSIVAGKVGDTFWWPLAKAVEAASGSPLEATLVMDANAEALTIPAAASLKLVKNGNTFAGTVAAADGATLNRTETPDYYLWEPVVPGGFVYPIEGTSGVAVSNEWLAANMSDIYGSDPTAPVLAGMTNALVTALSENGENGLPKWQSYVLGLDPADATATLRLTAAPVAGDATKIAITAVIDTTKFPTIGNVEVGYRLAARNAEGEWVDVADATVDDNDPKVFTVPLDSVAGKVLAIFADIVTK